MKIWNRGVLGAFGRRDMEQDSAPSVPAPEVQPVLGFDHVDDDICRGREAHASLLEETMASPVDKRAFPGLQLGF